jgi:2-C-methyl-D-erythritol 2,4-cyclodiphosphate synthase
MPPEQTINGPPATMRVGLGTDSHRLVPGGPLRLGGIDVLHDHHLDGHSDGDVLLHAITDALLGAAGAGDIGELFPDTDEANRGRDSAEMLVEAVGRVRSFGYALVNLDCVVMAEAPKLSPWKAAIAERIGELVGLPASRIGVKAKTGEGIGPVGTRQVIEVHVVALLALTEGGLG